APSLPRPWTRFWPATTWSRSVEDPDDRTYSPHRGKPQVVDAGRHVLRAVHDHARQHGRERRAAIDPARPARQHLLAGVDCERLHAVVRGAPGDGWAPWRPVRAPA